MTQPPNISLPPPGYPLVTRVISNALFPDPSPMPGGLSKEEPVTWVLGQPHPFVPSMNIVRMFVVRSGGVEIYSVASDGQGAMRNLLPMHWVRFVEEAMPIDIFIDELTLAEAGSDDDEPEPELEPELRGQPGDPANGQAGPALT